MAFAAGNRAAAPFKSLTTSVVLVEGPAMVNVLKSSLNYKIKPKIDWGRGHFRL